MKSEVANVNYGELLNRIEWKLKRKQILQRDNYRCRNCKSVSGLQIHHRQYQRYTTSGKFKSPWSYENRYLITLCNNCHRIGHQQYKVPVINL